jgi:hypothetical protein
MWIPAMHDTTRPCPVSRSDRVKDTPVISLQNPGLAHGTGNPRIDREDQEGALRTSYLGPSRDCWSYVEPMKPSNDASS